MDDRAVITALEASARNAALVVVRVGRRRAVTLSRAAVERLGLTVGGAWSDELAGRVRREAEYEGWLRQATRWTDRRMLSRSEVGAKLSAGGCDGELSDRVLSRLTELGLIDDAAMARLIVEREVERGGAGRLRVRAALERRGLRAQEEEASASSGEEEGASVAGACAGDGQPSMGELERATALAKDRAAAMRELPAATRYRRVAGFLSRKGYDEDTVRRALEAAGLAETGDGEAG